LEICEEKSKNVEIVKLLNKNQLNPSNFHLKFGFELAKSFVKVL